MSLRKLLPALMCISFAGAALADNTAAPLASGIDGSAMDRNVRPQDDLFRFVNGTWLTNTPFPAEYASAGIGIMLFEKAQADVHAILLEAAPPGTRRRRKCSASAPCTAASWTKRRWKSAASSP